VHKYVQGSSACFPAVCGGFSFVEARSAEQAALRGKTEKPFID
jgi:hypothetical protein